MRLKAESLEPYAPCGREPLCNIATRWQDSIWSRVGSYPADSLISSWIPYYIILYTEDEALLTENIVLSSDDVVVFMTSMAPSSDEVAPSRDNVVQSTENVAVLSTELLLLLYHPQSESSVCYPVSAYSP